MPQSEINLCDYLHRLLPEDPVILYDSVLLTSFIQSIQLLISLSFLFLIIYLTVHHCTVLTANLDNPFESKYPSHSRCTHGWGCPGRH